MPEDMAKDVLVLVAGGLILDFLRYATRYFLMVQQTYAWGLCNPTRDRSDRK